MFGVFAQILKEGWDNAIGEDNRKPTVYEEQPERKGWEAIATQKLASYDFGEWYLEVNPDFVSWIRVGDILSATVLIAQENPFYDHDDIDCDEDEFSYKTVSFKVDFTFDEDQPEVSVF